MCVGTCTLSVPIFLIIGAFISFSTKERMKNLEGDFFPQSLEVRHIM